MADYLIFMQAPRMGKTKLLLQNLSKEKRKDKKDGRRGGTLILMDISTQTFSSDGSKISGPRRAREDAKGKEEKDRFWASLHNRAGSRVNPEKAREIRKIRTLRDSIKQGRQISLKKPEGLTEKSLKGSSVYPSDHGRVKAGPHIRMPRTGRSKSVRGEPPASCNIRLWSRSILKWSLPFPGDDEGLVIVRCNQTKNYRDYQNY